MYRRALPLMVLAAAVACSTDLAAPPRDASPTATAALDRSPAGHDHGTGDGAYARDLATLKRVTAPLHRLEAAGDAGWAEAITDCMAMPDSGGMGFHYVNWKYFRDGKVAVDEPELLVYAPQKNGDMQLVAVEYAVPYDTWSSPNPPKLFGLEFHKNDAFQLYMLHVWLWKDNPKGMFKNWNPAVQCPVKR